MTTFKMPDRRAAVKGLAFVPLMAAPAAATTHADAALIETYAAFMAAWEDERAVYRSIDIKIAGDAEDQRINAAVVRTMTAGAKVSAIHAHTIEGLRCKAMVALHHHGDLTALVKADESGALASIASDLLAVEA